MKPTKVINLLINHDTRLKIIKPNPETVERYRNYKQPTAIKTVRLQPQLNLLHIPDTEVSPSLQLPSDLNSKTTSKIYPPFKTIQKPSTCLSNLLDTSLEQ